MFERGEDKKLKSSEGGGGEGAYRERGKKDCPMSLPKRYRGKKKYSRGKKR